MKFVFQLLKCIYRARNVFWSTVFEMNNHIITCLSNLSTVVNNTQTATKNSKHGRFPLEKIAVLTSDFPSESITDCHIHLAIPDLQSEVKNGSKKSKIFQTYLWKYTARVLKFYNL